MRVINFIAIILYFICVGVAAQVAIYTWPGNGLFIVLCQVSMEILGFWAAMSAGNVLNRR